ncbi:tRNA (adenosine(37)-N6)-threonylcarbamoyltransferase complex dimerization subunit type 1 TsaB [Kribbella solani]|uniref:tRNA (adenosine(37)-N6)-threonylcarbamoyltransferase complex dimerization subunit type 1 TsaB n=1 Tax=Kribbella solani TaxID=236067 RepID=UPI0029AB7B33|nr:tRNA (adenosine(37)-N6)-threonylcarbamoyltransferase complex dimerization subunit type 1 TsaB [Kribbella solani]MDX2971594.1 tRNA (adenosine(37)-N6)-threonylcarbamoyltransferase complex dimerization subunit type 1 TsaB [Kribbella solani]MDX3000696.1 tRNA (adenosine(37)-N6)-threonylcarbamoyltransferase complex dimerization subunit type 1 TsaB [Kribbella solani]
MLLAFDTSSAAVTVALATPTGEIVASSTTVDALRHGELLAPAIAAALETAGVTPRDLTGIAVGVGPGPFTGLRVGLVTARTMGEVLGIEVSGVCSLDVLARQSSLTLPVAVATDARRKEIYWALYDGPAADGSRRRLEGPAVDKPAEVAHVLSGLPVIGRGAVLYADALGVAGADVTEYPSAEVLATGVATRTLEVVPPEPLYLRRPDVTMSGGPKRVSQNPAPTAAQGSETSSKSVL